tara:strand:- start:20365 stop:21072 length:708 start_codon:yes stop_codon:yes gene_type:complete
MDSFMETLSKAGSVPESVRVVIDGGIENIASSLSKQLAIAAEHLGSYTDEANKHISAVTNTAKEYEDKLFKTPVATVSKLTVEYPYAVAGAAFGTSLIALPGTRRLLYRSFLGARSSEEAVFNSCQRSGASAKESATQCEAELKLLKDLATSGEVEMIKGRNKLRQAASDLKRLQKKALSNSIIVEDVLADLRRLPSKESVALRTDVAITQSSIGKVRRGVDAALNNVWRAGVQI